MARRRYRRKYYRSKGRWSANIKTLTNQSIVAPQLSSFFAANTLCENPVQVDSTVSQQYTVKNIEFSYEIESPNSGNTNQIESLCAYIMYVPQGMTVTETYPNSHPEYIMAYRFLGSPNSEGSGDNLLNPGRLPSKIKTRLSRRLQTGDSVIFLITGVNGATTQNILNLNGLIRWWTKAN